MDVFEQHEQCLVTRCIGMQHPTEGTRSLFTLKNYLEAVLSMIPPYLQAEMQVTRSYRNFPQLAVSKKKKKTTSYL